MTTDEFTEGKIEQFEEINRVRLQARTQLIIELVDMLKGRANGILSGELDEEMPDMDKNTAVIVLMGIASALLIIGNIGVDTEILAGLETNNGH